MRDVSSLVCCFVVIAVMGSFRMILDQTVQNSCQRHLSLFFSLPASHCSSRELAGKHLPLAMCMWMGGCAWACMYFASLSYFAVQIAAHESLYYLERALKRQNMETTSRLTYNEWPSSLCSVKARRLKDCLSFSLFSLSLAQTHTGPLALLLQHDWALRQEYFKIRRHTTY